MGVPVDPSMLGTIGSYASTLGNTAQNVGSGLWSGLSSIGQGVKNSGLLDLANTGTNFWQAYQQNDMNKDLMGQRKTELGMQQEAFNRDKSYQDALKSIDWSSQTQTA